MASAASQCAVGYYFEHSKAGSTLSSFSKQSTLPSNSISAFALRHKRACHNRKINAGLSKGGTRAALEEGEKPTKDVQSGEGAQISSTKTEEREQTANGPAQQGGASKKKRQADSTDFISSALTRRFGLAGGLAWLGVLSFGVISEQVKTRREVYEAEQNTKDVTSAKEVTLPDGVRYTDLVIGGGQMPQRGDLLLINFSGIAKSKDGSTVQFADTFAKGQRAIAFVFGGRPFAGGLSQGVEEALSTTRSGGKRRVVVPPELGFGEGDVVLQNGLKVPGGSTLEYTVVLERVSIAPS